MLIVHVHVHVKPESIDGFKKATVENAKASIEEPGITRFDVVQNADDSTRFVLVEVYCTMEAAVQHKETTHYKTWRDTVAGMMAESRSSVKYSEVFPPAERW